MFLPSELKGVFAIGVESFDGGDLFADGSGGRSDARSDGFSIEQDRTSATKPLPAPVFGSGLFEDIAQEPQQRHLGVCVDLVHLLVDVKCEHRFSSLVERGEPHTRWGGCSEVS